MKPLTIEAKAKAYDYAVNKAKELILNENGVVRVDKPLFDELFPSKMEESEDERLRNMIINTINRDKILTEDEAYDCVTWLEKQGEKKPWSEEDNFMYNRIKNLLTDISLAPESINSLSDWLKDLKDRVQPQQGWSEEDNRYLYGLIGLIEQSKAEIPITLKGKAADNCIDWLKSLSPKNRWKPSEEMLKALDIAIRAGIQLGSWEEGALRELQKQLIEL